MPDEPLGEGAAATPVELAVEVPATISIGSWHPPPFSGKGYSPAPVSTWHDGSAGNQRGYDLMVGGLTPLQQLPQPTIACGPSQGVQGTQEGYVALLLSLGSRGIE
jgi:hypothetical protein